MSIRCFRAMTLGIIAYIFCSIQKLGQVSQKIFPRTETLHPTIGDFLLDFGFAIGLLLWGFGLVWLFFAVASTLRTRRFPFNLGWWAFTFPLGVFSTCTNQLGQDIPSRFFRVLGTVCLFTCCAGLFRGFFANLRPRSFHYAWCFCG